LKWAWHSAETNLALRKKLRNLHAKFQEAQESARQIIEIWRANPELLTQRKFTELLTQRKFDWDLACRFLSFLRSASLFQRLLHAAQVCFSIQKKVCHTHAHFNAHKPHNL